MEYIVINSSLPKDWRDLQIQVEKIMKESGLIAESEKDIETVRGIVNIDVYAEDTSQRPKTIYLCECKFWQKAIPKSVVHSFRTVVNDFGANWGLIISSHGFQAGTFAAAANSNIRLLTWNEFQELFLERWFKNYMQKRLSEENEPLVDYTEPFNARVFRKANKLDKKSQRRFTKLREKYVDLAFLALGLYLPLPSILKEDIPSLPLRKSIESDEVPNIKNVPDILLDAVSFRDLLKIFISEDRKALAEFDDVFGERV
jgi:hypothetical protein